MKFITNKTLTLFIGVLGVNLTFAAPTPPVPTPPGPTPPPELPVDAGLMVLFFVSLIYAFYKIYTIKKVFRLRGH